jgi:hypothetical protein
VKLRGSLPRSIGLRNHVEVVESPDKPNIFLEKRRKPPNVDIAACAEAVYKAELEALLAEEEEYPVTLCYMPLEWCSDAQSLAITYFGPPNLKHSRYALLFSTQDEDVCNHVVTELKKRNPILRLIFCSSSVGMGFDSPCISRVIHAKPPRNMLDFVQQIGRAGRLGQKSESVMYFNASDIARNVEGLSDDVRLYCTTDDCMRKTLLSAFGFNKNDKITDCECCMNCQQNCQCSKCIVGK